MTKMLLSFIFILCSFNSVAQTPTRALGKVLKLEINASINPATYDYLQSGIDRATAEGFSAILITMNTPGGLVSTTKDILTSFGKSDVPIIIWVAPEAASATSAGAIISAGSHVLYMAPGTNIGAAAPVSMGKDIDGPAPEKDKNKDKDQDNQNTNSKDKSPQEQVIDNLKGSSDMKKKAVNDLVALIRSLSEARGRNGEHFALMISEAKSYTANEALEKNIIDGIVSTESQLINDLNGKEISIKGEQVLLKSDERTFTVFHKMDLGQSILNIFANPSLAYMLFLLGAALLYFELQAPGGFIAGSVGAVCLVLAAIAFQVLPLNIGALGLIVLAFILFIIEIYVTSFGLLSLAGLISLVMGSIFLFRGSDGSAEVPITLIISTITGIGAFIVLIAFVILKDYKKITKENDSLYDLAGKKAIINKVKGKQSDDFFHYMVKVKGEMWEALSKFEFHLKDEVMVEKQDNETITLVITKL